MATVPAADPDALGAALNRLLGDDAFRAWLGRAALDRVKGELALDRIVGRMIEVYVRLAANGAGDPVFPRAGAASAS